MKYDVVQQFQNLVMGVTTKAVLKERFLASPTRILIQVDWGETRVDFFGNKLLG